MDFLEKIVSSDTVPAGGAAAAYAASLGVALLFKVLLIELNRPNVEAQSHAALAVAQKEIESLHNDLKRMLEEDPQCFLRFSSTRKDPDRAASKAAFLDIITCSMRVMEKASEGLDWVGKLSKMSSRSLSPHLRVATELLAAGLSGTAHVVRANLKPLQYPEKRNRYWENLESCYEQGMLKKA
ncbi:MAG: cyclodeaminase/cyclohydrolase family protein, partial [Desulfomonile tiedjei]|nr:cyclodeaminase/cyclohydrolase family protein [Desulfomonile tiedjei]